MTLLCERGKPTDTATNRPYFSPVGTWTIDPADSTVTSTWRTLRLGTITGRLHSVGVIHLDDLPPVGVIRFEQPSGLPVLTMAIDPASIQTHDADLDTRLRSSEVFDVLRHRWWTLRSGSLEVLPSGAWRVMTTLTTNGTTTSAVELRLEIDPAASSADRLVLRGHGMLDRRGFGIGGPGSTFSPQIRIDLAVRARRVGGPQGRPDPPIGRYRRVPVQVYQADPHAPEVARRLIALIATRWPTTPAEHVGSSAVPGLAGKNIIDLLLASTPADVPTITAALLELGFQPQAPAAFPASRPMLWGTVHHRASDYRVHVHVVPAASPEIAALRGFRDALRADPCLRRR
jgi:GrpB-like predicted nucleotidyltransferase (UPF0157 family)/polyisoprenoid-binding protein YceI